MFALAKQQNLIIHNYQNAISTFRSKNLTCYTKTLLPFWTVPKDPFPIILSSIKSSFFIRFTLFGTPLSKKKKQRNSKKCFGNQMPYIIQKIKREYINVDFAFVSCLYLLTKSTKFF